MGLERMRARKRMAAVSTKSLGPFADVGFREPVTLLTLPSTSIIS